LSKKKPCRLTTQNEKCPQQKGRKPTDPGHETGKKDKGKKRRREKLVLRNRRPIVKQVRTTDEANTRVKGGDEELKGGKPNKLSRKAPNPNERKKGRIRNHLLN